MSIKSIIGKTVFCFAVTVNKWDGAHLFYQTILLVFYSRFFKRQLRKNTKTIELAVSTHKGPYEIRLRMQDIPIFYEVFDSNVYALSVSNHTNGIVLDIGAHIGLASVYFWDRHFPNSKYYCIEPSKENVKLLEFNTRHLDRTIINACISNFNGYSTLNKEGLGHNNKLSLNPNASNKIEVYTMDSLFVNYKIPKYPVVKMDIEGEESLIFKAKNLWLNNIELLIIELHDDYDKMMFQADLKRTIKGSSFKVKQLNKSLFVVHFDRNIN